MNPAMIVLLVVGLGTGIISIFFKNTKSIWFGVVLSLLSLTILCFIILVTYSEVGLPVTGIGTGYGNMTNSAQSYIGAFNEGDIYVKTSEMSEMNVDKRDNKSTSFYFKMKQLLKDGKEDIFEEIFTSTNKQVPDTSVYLNKQFVRLNKKQVKDILSLNLDPEQIKEYLKNYP